MTLIQPKTYSELSAFIDVQPSLSLEDVYQIGLMHKRLPRTEKNWKTLATKLGYSNSEQLRQYIIRRQKQDGTLATRDLVPIVTDNKAYEADYKERTKIRDIYNAYRLYLRNDARAESLQETIKQCAEAQAKFPIRLGYSCQPTAEPSGEALLLLSDWHVGQLVNNFYNQYDFEIAKHRVSKIVSDAVEYCHRLNVAKLHVLNMGDLVEGIINVNGRINQQEDVCTQLMYATELLSQALYQLQEAAPVVTYRSCVDNHSRLIADKHQNIAAENLNRITDWYLKERLANTSVQICEDNLDRGFGKFTLDNGMKVVFFHGHEDSKSQTLQDVVGATQEWIDIVCCGHWHNPSEHTYQNMKLFVNNSLSGTGDYALSKRLFTKPSQKLIVIENKNFIDIDIDADN